MPEYSEVESRASQLFHNFLDIMVKSETYPAVSDRLHAMLESVEDECSRDVSKNPDDDVEREWLAVVKAFRAYLWTIADCHNNETRPLLEVVSHKLPKDSA